MGDSRHICYFSTEMSSSLSNFDQPPASFNTFGAVPRLAHRSKFQVRGGLMLVNSTTIVGSGFLATLTRTTFLQSLLAVCELLLTNFFILTVCARVESYNILLRVHFMLGFSKVSVCTTLAVLIWSLSAQQTSS